MVHERGKRVWKKNHTTTIRRLPIYAVHPVAIGAAQILLYLDHPKFKASQRGIDKTQTTEAVDSSETVISVTSGEAGLFRADDYVYMQEANNQLQNTKTN